MTVIEELTDRCKIGFVYKITSPSNRIYIGSTKNWKSRFSQYRNLHCKRQPKLYASFIKHGVDNHSFEIIGLFDLKILKKKESELGLKFNVLSKKGLNLSLPKEGELVFSVSNETRRKIRLLKIGKPRSEETKHKLRIAQTGKKHSELARKRMSESSRHISRRHSEETKNKISLSRIGIKLSEEHKAKINPLGRKHSEETKLKISIGNKGKIISEDQRKKQSENMIGNKNGVRKNKQNV